MHSGVKSKNMQFWINYLISTATKYYVIINCQQSTNINIFPILEDFGFFVMTSSDDVYDGAEILLLRVYLSFVLYVMNIPIAFRFGKACMIQN